MKKYILITAIVLMGALTACSSDDNKDNIDDKASRYEGTWIADNVSYEINNEKINVDFLEIPSKSKVYNYDKLVITKTSVNLYEYRESVNNETKTEGVLDNNNITFNDIHYSKRTITGIEFKNPDIENDQLAITYAVHLDSKSIQVTVIYNREVASPITTTWLAHTLSYKFGDRELNHYFMEMPGEFAVYDNDKLVLSKLTNTLTITLYEYKKSTGKETQVKGNVKNNIITFEDISYPTRKIIKVQDDVLTVVYDITMRGATLPVTVTYNKQ